jgi:truncated hemoglobin YjbI
MATPDSNRARRFSLPDLGDERVDEAITAFLSGPKHKRGRPDGPAIQSAADNPFGSIQNRVAWMEALRRESARNLRYRRPAAVMVVAGVPSVTSPEASAWLKRVAGPIAHAVQRGIRETDLVTRTAEARFQVLLPETTGREAARVAERVEADCEIWLRAIGAPIVLRSAAAGATTDSTLESALARALETIERPDRA